MRDIYNRTQQVSEGMMRNLHHAGMLWQVMQRTRCVNAESVQQENQGSSGRSAQPKERE